MVLRVSIDDALRAKVHRLVTDYLGGQPVPVDLTAEPAATWPSPRPRPRPTRPTPPPPTTDQNLYIQKLLLEAAQPGPVEGSRHSPQTTAGHPPPAPTRRPCQAPSRTGWRRRTNVAEPA